MTLCPHRRLPVSWPSVAKHSVQMLMSVSMVWRGRFVWQQELSASTCHESGKSSYISTYSLLMILLTTFGGTELRPVMGMITGGLAPDEEMVVDVEPAASHNKTSRLRPSLARTRSWMSSTQLRWPLKMSGGILWQSTGAKRNNTARAVAPVHPVAVGFGQLEVGIPVPVVAAPRALR